MFFTHYFMCNNHKAEFYQLVVANSNNNNVGIYLAFLTSKRNADKSSFLAPDSKVNERHRGT